MKAIDFRNENFEALRARLVEKREAVWLDWIAYEVAMVGQRPPGAPQGATTREVCEWMKRDILAFRPRCTELYQMGVLMLVPPLNVERSTLNVQRSKEGLYRLRTMEEWQAWHTEQQQLAISRQLQMVV